MATNPNSNVPNINIFGISNHGTDINFTTNPTFAGYKTNDVENKQLSRKVQNSWEISHASQNDLLDYHALSIPDQAALKTMGITQRDTLTVNLEKTSVKRHLPVIRQAKDPSIMKPDGTYGKRSDFCGRLFCPFGPSVWDYPMVGESSIDKDAEKFLVKWQNIDISLLPNDPHLACLLLQMAGENFFMNCCLRKLAPLLSNVVQNLKTHSPQDPRTHTLSHVDDNLFALTEIAKQHSILLLNIRNSLKYKEEGALSQLSTIITNRRDEYLFENNKVVKNFSPYTGLFLDPRSQENNLKNKQLIRLRAQKRKRTQSFLDTSKPKPPENYICHTCEKRGHWRRDCPLNQKSTSFHLKEISKSTPSNSSTPAPKNV